MRMIRQSATRALQSQVARPYQRYLFARLSHAGYGNSDSKAQYVQRGVGSNSAKEEEQHQTHTQRFKNLTQQKEAGSSQSERVADEDTSAQQPQTKSADAVPPPIDDPHGYAPPDPQNRKKETFTTT
ncbi:hypothetical protein BC832DRAFT_554754 [Gaertneriomyces semiglobifer]|nr:hypothetical protein BC832DRAFT_554754 [Gaertneriomyces semiglobifer]